MKKPPQGTSKIFNPEADEKRGRHAAEKTFNDVVARLEIENEPDSYLIFQTNPDSDAWMRLVAKYGKQTVAESYRNWRFAQIGRAHV